MKTIFSKKVKLAILLGFLVTSLAWSGSASYWDASIWTTWHLRRSWLMGLLELSKIRKNLETHNLHDSYANQKDRDKPDCTPLEKKIYRQADGTCNDLEITGMGAVGTRFGRNSDPAKLPVRVSDDEVLSPNPRVISRELLARDSQSKESYIPAKTLNLLAATWIQFEVHDWVFHGENMNDIHVTHPYVVPYDEHTSRGDSSELIIPRTEVDVSRQDDNPGFPTYRNHVTHWWDASQIYGSDRAFVDCSSNKTAQSLRECVGGRLKLGEQGLLPLDLIKDKEATGFSQNWWVGLSLLHTAFVRNHNYLAAELAKTYPTWNDEKLFQIARLVNAAIIAKIHTVEWTPGILGHPYLNIGMKANWYGIEHMGTQHLHAKTIGFLQKICHGKSELCKVLGGLVGSEKDLHGVPYSLTEEFTSVYRLHSLLPESIQVQDQGRHILVPMNETREKLAHSLVEKYSPETLIEAFGRQNPGALTIGNFPRFMRELVVPIPGVSYLPELKFDLAATDLVRDRERGVPRYNEFRRQLGLKPIRTFTDLMPQVATPELGVDEAQALKNQRITKKIAEIYGDVEKIDLLVGTLAEGYRPQGYGFGETMFQVFVLMASRRLEADRFYSSDFNEKTYSKKGIELVEVATFKSVLTHAFPKLNPDEIPENAFAPWKGNE